MIHWLLDASAYLQYKTEVILYIPLVRVFKEVVAIWQKTSVWA